MKKRSLQKKLTIVLSNVLLREKHLIISIGGGATVLWVHLDKLGGWVHRGDFAWALWRRLALMVDLPSEALHRGLYQWLTRHVRNQVLNCGHRFLAERLAFEVDWYERASFNPRMCQEDLKEEGQLLAALLQELRFQVSKVLLLREGWHAIGATDLALNHGLEFSQTWVTILQVKGYVARANDLEDVNMKKIINCCYCLNLNILH